LCASYFILNCTADETLISFKFWGNTCIIQKKAPARMYSRSLGPNDLNEITTSVQDIFRRTFLSNCWWQKSDIGSQASYKYTILWVAFLDPSDSYFLFADLVGFYTVKIQPQSCNLVLANFMIIHHSYVLATFSWYN
jgi:hypothetical protein